MTRALTAVALLAALAAGCKSREAQLEAEWLTEDEARAALELLPEVAAWRAKLAGDPGGAKAVCTIERTPTECRDAGEAAAWRMKFASVTAAGTTDWKRFQVDAGAGEVGIYVPARKQYVPIEMWRQGFVR